MKGKTPLSHKVVCFQMLDFETSILNLRSRNQIRGKQLLSRKLCEGAVSHNVLYYQPILSTITRHKVRFYGHNNFE